MGIIFRIIKFAVFKWIVLFSFLTCCRPCFLDYCRDGNSGILGVCVHSSEDCPEGRLGQSLTSCPHRGHDGVCCPLLTNSQQNTSTNITPKKYESACKRDCPRCSPPPGRAEVEPHSWPWMVAVTFKDNQRSAKCGGFLVTKQHVVTVAHCLHHDRGLLRDPEDMFVLVGAHDTKNSGQLMKIDGMVIHQDYKIRSISYADIGIIRLEKEVELSAEVQPACVIEHGDVDLEGKTLTLLGWGNSDPEIQKLVIDKLQSVQVPVVNKKTCEELWAQRTTLKVDLKNDDFFCGGDLTMQGGPRTSGACMGESGGPIMMQDSDGLWKVVGMATNGAAPCTELEFKAPDIYTRLSTYWYWVKDVIANDGER